MKLSIVALALVSLTSSSFVTNNKSRFLDFISKGVESVGKLVHGKVVGDRSFCLEKDNKISKDVTKKCCNDTYKGENLIHFNELEFFCSWGDDRLKGCCEQKQLSFCKGECPQRK